MHKCRFVHSHFCSIFVSTTREIYAQALKQQQNTSGWKGRGGGVWLGGGGVEKWLPSIEICHFAVRLENEIPLSWFKTNGLNVTPAVFLLELSWNISESCENLCCINCAMAGGYCENCSTEVCIFSEFRLTAIVIFVILMKLPSHTHYNSAATWWFNGVYNDQIKWWERVEAQLHLSFVSRNNSPILLDDA